MNARTRSTSAKIDFSASDRQTKQLITLDGVSYAVGDRTLFRDISFHYHLRHACGAGWSKMAAEKTTLLRLLKGELKPNRAALRQADSLRIVYFDQNRELDPDITLRRSLAPDSDSVIYKTE